MPFAEGDDATETLLFHRADEPLGIRGEIGTLRRETDRLDTPALQDLAKDPRGERVAVVNQIAGASQAALDRVRQIAGHLLHPRAVRLRMDPGDGHAAGLQRDHEEDQVPLEPGQREHLDGEQIAGREALPVRLQERLPGHAPAPLGSRVDPVVVQDPLHRGPSDLVAEVRERPADPVYPHWGFSTAIRTTSAATSRRVIGRPRPRRALPSYVWAINLRYQRRIVSGVTMPATCITTRRPSFWPRTASRRRWASVRRSGRGPRCSRRTRFSSRRYAIRSSWWRVTQPANVRTRNWSAGGMA